MLFSIFTIFRFFISFRVVYAAWSWCGSFRTMAVWKESVMLKTPPHFLIFSDKDLRFESKPPDTTPYLFSPFLS